MILQALVKRYEDAVSEKQKPGWGPRPVDFHLNIDENGEILGLIPCGEAKGKRGEGQLPETEARSSGIKPYFLCDNVGYMLGVDTKDKEGQQKNDGAKKYAAAKELHLKVLAGVDTPAAAAIRNYFSKAPNIARAEQLFRESVGGIPETRNDLAFKVDGRYAYEDESIQRAWDSYYMARGRSTGRILDLVTGREDTIQPLQGEVRLRGVSMGKKPLVSINADSFASYGKSAKDPAATIGCYASYAYVAALNDLLADKYHHKFLGGDTLVYWAENGGENEAAIFSWCSEPKEEDNDKLDAIMENISVGKPSCLENCDFERAFYVLCMSPNAGRISVRFFHRSSFGNVLLNIARHYENLEISSSRVEKFRFLPAWIILSETTVKKTASDAAPLLGGQLLNSIVTGARYPMTLYTAMLTRIRAGEEVNRQKAAVMKAILIRNYTEREVAAVSLNEQSSNKPYVLGRLFAALEKLQKDASEGKLNATIRDRYFASACANPASVFPVILKLSIHHSAKLDRALYYENLKAELLGKLDADEPFPSALGLDDQGRFILGYYHQMQRFYTKKTTEETIDE